MKTTLIFWILVAILFCGTTACSGHSSYTERANGAAIEMVYVEGGTFTMGCTSEQSSDCMNSEKPAHQVTLSSYYIGKYEVTQAQWKAVMGDSPSKFKGDNFPVESINWYEAMDFCRELSRLTGREYRLLTEAEWEYAARGGKKSKGAKYSGSSDIERVAWHIDNCEYQMHAVGSKSPNELGIYDMSGNVWELCNDWCGAYESGSQTNPGGASEGSYRVIRGGSLYNDTWTCRVVHHSGALSGDRHNTIGFRIASGSEH